MIEDMVKLLDRIPIWKRLQKVPEEIEALSARLTALEAELTKRPSLEDCPLCGIGKLHVKSVQRHATFGDVGLQERNLKCDNPECGHSEARVHDPSGRMGSKR